jgi:hypothetical protein
MEDLLEMSNWVSYKNGNYTVRINLETGTKIRENKLDYLRKIINSLDKGIHIQYLFLKN